MELQGVIREDACKEETFIVRAEDIAENVGSGGFNVLATPAMVAYAERVAYRMLQDSLPPEYSSVGTYIEMYHLAPTPGGDKVTISCRVTEVQGRRVAFAIEAHDTKEKVGEGRHIRVIVESKRFLGRLVAKMDSKTASSLE